jgi:PAS domain S-box-containing protein
MKSGSQMLVRLALCALLFVLPQFAWSAVEAHAGRMDLAQWQFQRDGMVALEGEWEKVRGLVGGDAPWPAESTVIRQPLDSPIARQVNEGASTYRLRIDCSDGVPLAIMVPFMPTAATVFVNGREMARQGTPGLSPATHRPALVRQSVPLEGIRCPLEVRVQMSNFEMHRSGVQRGFSLGARDEVQAIRETSLAHNVVAMTSTAVVGIFAALSFVTRRRERSDLYLALFCLFLAVFIGISGERVLQSALAGIGFEGQLRLLLSNFFLLFASGQLLLHSLYPRAVSRSIVLFLVSFCGTGVAISLLTPISVFAHTGPLAWFAWLATAVYSVVALGRATYMRERGAAFALTSSAILFASSVHDNATVSYMHMGSAQPVAFVCVVLVLALLLVQRFNRALANEELRAIEQSERADLLVRAAKAGVLDWDVPNKHVHASERYREMLGLPTGEDAEVQAFESLLHPNDRERIAANFEARRRERSSGGLHRWEPMEFRMVRPDGAVLWMHAEAISICGADGRALRHICTFIDITHLKATEQQLREAQTRLVAEARRAGMAQIATNVLHNVGNVLTSVNVSAHVLVSRLRQSRSARLADVARMLDNKRDDLDGFLATDEKGKLLPDYVNELAEALATERQDLLAELARLGSSVDHIKNVVAMQQSYAGSGGLLEGARISDLADDALRMHEDALTRRRVKVVREFANVPPTPLDKTRVMQILVNLLDNARQAMEATAGDRRLHIKVGERTGWIDLSVTDTGCGIAAQDLPKIFSHGFTTKLHGHGFGLHSCVLAAREMGGELTVHSDGPGRGATFTLRLPTGEGAAPPERAIAQTGLAVRS